MLKPNEQRLDYGGNLKPPQNYELDFALATSYSLDLNAVLSLPVALCLNTTLEGDLQGEKIALFEAIEQLAGKFKVFYQSGEIHIPKEYNRLFTLLEDFIVPIVPEAQSGDVSFSSFHPKFWLIRYKNSTTQKDIKYRLLVLSRNLTFDRSWDLAASIDGELKHKGQNSYPYLKEFVKSFSHFAPGFEFFSVAGRELPRVKWSCPNGFSQLRMLPGGGAHLRNGISNFGRPVDFSSRVDELLVVSPFLDDKRDGGLEWLAAQTEGEKHLFSRAEELDKFGSEVLKNWDCYSLNSHVVDGEELLEQDGAITQNLHAKLFVSKHGQTSHWHLGSANATSAALGGISDAAPRNSEFMIRLTGKADNIGPSTLLDSLVGDDENGLFVKHTFSVIELEEKSVSETEIRRLAHSLISTSWSMVALQNNERQYDIVLKIDQEVLIPTGLNVKVALLCQNLEGEALAHIMSWSGIPLTSVSAFVPVKIVTDSGDVVERLLIQTALEIEGGDDRVSHILRSLVDTDKKFMSYIRLLLQREPDKEQWLNIDQHGRGGREDGGIDFEQPIFEQLMFAASRNPQQLERIDLLVSRLQKLGGPVPDEFLNLWAHFKPLL